MGPCRHGDDGRGSVSILCMVLTCRERQMRKKAVPTPGTDQEFKGGIAQRNLLRFAPAARSNRICVAALSWGSVREGGFDCQNRPAHSCVPGTPVASGHPVLGRLCEGRADFGRTRRIRRVSRRLTARPSPLEQAAQDHSGAKCSIRTCTWSIRKGRPDRESEAPSLVRYNYCNTLRTRAGYGSGSVPAL